MHLGWFWMRATCLCCLWNSSQWAACVWHIANVSYRHFAVIVCQRVLDPRWLWAICGCKHPWLEAVSRILWLSVRCLRLPVACFTSWIQQSPPPAVLRSHSASSLWNANQVFWVVVLCLGFVVAALFLYIYINCCSFKQLQLFLSYSALFVPQQWPYLYHNRSHRCHTKFILGRLFSI